MEDYLKLLVIHFKEKEPLKFIRQMVVLTLIVILLLIAWWIIRQCGIWGDLWDLLINLLASAVAFILAYYFVIWISNRLQKYEDELKVSYKNSEMLEIYKNKYEDKKHPYRKAFHLHQGDKTPCIVYCDELFLASEIKGGIKIEDHPNELFQLDTFIQAKTLKLYEAHSQSNKEVSLTVRLSDFEKPSKENNFTATLTTTRSTYLNHLLTNRALDYPIKTGITIRKLYENGQYLMPLPFSKMSNHIGINALVFLTGDEKQYLIVPRRGKNATVVKNGITASIATRLKMDIDKSIGNFKEKYQSILSSEYITEDCIIDNFERALLLTKDGLKIVKKDAKIHFLGLARDPYEGGKPTLFYYVELNMTCKQFWELTKPNYTKGEIDEIEELMLVEWNDIIMDIPSLEQIQKKLNAKLKVKDKDKNIDGVEKADLEEALRYDEGKLTLKKYYTRSVLDKKGHYQEVEHLENPFIFEQNLITNFWFYLKHTGEIK